MKRFIMVCIVFALSGCSQEQREDAIDRVANAAKELNGELNTTPVIVAEAKRKEKRRQNTLWTKENQALYPIEYCQAQLEELTKMAQSLQVQVHSVATTKASVQRKREDGLSQIEILGKLLKEAKAAYREADVKDKWPMELNGFQLTKERSMQKIVDVAQKISTQKTFIDKSKNILASLEKKLVKLDVEQRKLVSVREKVQSTIDALKTKQIVEGVNGVSGAMDAINDSMASLGVDTSDPSIEDILIPSIENDRVQLFKKIMAEDE